MKKVILFFAGTILFAGLTFGQDNAKKVIDVKANKIEATRGADPNIKTERPTVDNPAPKPDESTRGDYCTVWVDNWTGYAIDIYVDGKYAGTIPAYEKQQTWAIPGETKLYGKSTGGTKSWGPSWLNCAEKFTWKLNP